MSLTSLERVLKSINHITPDVVPVGPFAGYYASEFSKIKIFDYISDGRTNRSVARITGYDRKTVGVYWNEYKITPLFPSFRQIK
jgi:hypothetical protein